MFTVLWLQKLCFLDQKFVKSQINLGQSYWTINLYCICHVYICHRITNIIISTNTHTYMHSRSPGCVRPGLNRPSLELHMVICSSTLNESVMRGLTSTVAIGSLHFSCSGSAAGIKHKQYCDFHTCIYFCSSWCLKMSKCVTICKAKIKKYATLTFSHRINHYTEICDLFINKLNIKLATGFTATKHLPKQRRRRNKMLFNRDAALNT